MSNEAMTFESEYLSLKQAAQERGVTPMTIFLWIRSGLLPAHRLGRAYIISRADLAAVPATIPERRAIAQVSKVYRQRERQKAAAGATESSVTQDKRFSHDPSLAS
jgi:excisionase family DNA binding protein